MTWTRVIGSALPFVLFVSACGSSDDSGNGGPGAGVGGSGTGGKGTGTGGNASGIGGAATGTGGSGSGTPGTLTGNEMLDAHNQIRRNAKPTPNPPLEDFTWDEKLVESAQKWANGCKFEHSGSGENLFATSDPVPKTPTYVVNSWADEVHDYSYGSNSCSGVCGHYTQIVWRDTERVGCAFAKCPNIANIDWEGFLWVCHYEYPGNYVGEKPY